MTKQKISHRRVLSAWCKRERFPLIAFFLTFFSLLIFAAAYGLAPFGDKSLLSMDLWGQYYPMIVEAVENPFSLWSWNGALGYSAIAQNAYYTNSILNILLLPFSSYARIAAMDILLFLKLSLASAVFAHFLEKKSGKGSLLVTAFGVAYGLSAYMTTYIAQPMWLDIAILAPLVILGLEKMLAGGGPWLYVFTLALSIYSNFYIGFALCIFVGLWFIASMFTDGIRRSGKRILGDTGKFALMSAASAALAGFVLVPLYFCMQTWISASLSAEVNFEVYHSFSEILDNLTFGAKPEWEYGVANLYCGAAAIFFFLLFLFNGEIPMRKRIVFGAFSVFMLLSFEIRALDFIWHGFHYPNQLPARQSFLFALLILWLAHEALSHRQGLHAVGISLGAILSAGIFFIGLENSEMPVLRVVSAAIILLFAVLLLAYRYFRADLSRAVLVLMAVLLLGESMASGIFVLTKYGRTTDARSYILFDEDMMAMVEKYESGKDDFYRTEMTLNQTFDPAMLYDFKGITYYSSTMNGEIYLMMERLGDRVYAQNVSTIYQPTPIQDMMFGVRYHYTTVPALVDYGTIAEKSGKITVIESPWTLGVAFAADKDLAYYTSEGKTAMDAQNEFVCLAADLTRDAVTSVFHGVLSTENARVFVSSGKDYASTYDIEESSTVRYTMEPQEDGLLFIDLGHKVGTFTVYINGVKTVSGDCGRTPLVYGGEVTREDVVEMDVTWKGYNTVLAGIDAYTVNPHVMDEAYMTLAPSALRVEKATDTVIRGTVMAAEDGVLYSSIPANMGWQIYIDGEKAEPFALDGALLCCDITAGEHEIVYRYHAPGLGIGIGISAVGAMILACYAIYKKQSKKKDRV